MNPGLSQLHPYPFEKLADLFKDADVNNDLGAIDLSIGEPRHKTPSIILDSLRSNLALAASYPKTRASDELRQVIADWLIKRFNLPKHSISADKHILPVNGTREALFAIAQCVVERMSDKPVVIMPNPFYQIYEGAALLAGARPCYLNCLPSNDFLPDIDVVPDSVWESCQLIYLCSPGNPTGAVMPDKIIEKLLELADKYDFVVAADECYSEIYMDEQKPPRGLLQIAAELGRDNYHRCLVFHSLSKRSNVPGMRSGFVAGDETLIHAFLRYRTYHGCAMPGFTQAASVVAWGDEQHVIENRRLYREKFNAVIDILNPVIDVTIPEGGFYLWPEMAICDREFSRQLYIEQSLTVLPGSFLSREVDGINPGQNRVRIALVPEYEQCIEAANRIKNFINNH